MNLQAHTRTSQRPIASASKYWRTPRAPTPHPSPGEIAAHSASQAALSASPCASAPSPTRPGQATHTTITSPLGAHAPLTPEEAPQ